MKTNFRIWNRLAGWSTFLIAFITYYLTMEPTVSWWDCGEFIASASKLEVGHPPGASLFMLIGRVFASIAPDPTKVAWIINLISVLASAFTVLFLFWTITHMGRKLIAWNKAYSLTEKIMIIGAGLVGSLVFAFSDSFWFSAVEGEVYALSSLFTAVVFWAILKWEAEWDNPYALRWILLIAYLMGLSIGIHLLNLLAIPAIVFIYYFKKYPTSLKGILLTFALSVFLVLFIMYGVIPGVVTLASWFELFFINLFGLPFNSGVIIFAILIIGLTAWGIYETHKRGKVLWNTVLLAFSVIMLGYSSYATIVVRANANPPMEQNNPDEVFKLIKYLNREQYGDHPLLYGAYFNAPVIGQKKGKPTYTRIDGKYEITDRVNKRVYDKRFMTIFPRMWHNSPAHEASYNEWAQIEGSPIQVKNNEGEPKLINKPKFGENLRFFFSYQLGHMYFRYFMWNFVGRQDDIQSHGGIQHGNWMSGIKFIDEARLGPLDKLPDTARNHRARNVYYFLPFLLGLFGVIHQYRKGNKDFWVIFLLFLYTGIAIVVYLNQWPNQPRERDYAFAGSYYSFAIWVGLGVLGLFSALKRKANSESRSWTETRFGPLGGIGIVLLGLLIPTLMAFENWDDHDRSNRYMARDFAYNYLNSCAPNAILFTNGDNDTFPLWYAQEVEGVRTDVRVICLPYLAADWYIEQMTRKAYESEPIPFSLSPEQYRMGKRDYLPFFQRIEGAVNLKDAIDFVASDDEGSKVPLRDGTSIDHFPTNKFKLPVDSAKVVRNGTVPPEDADKIVPEIVWEIKRGGIGKNDLMILDLLAHNNWDRPVYFTSIMHQNMNGLKDYFRLEGLAYRFVPIKNSPESGQTANINTTILYDNFMHVFDWGNMEDPKTWVDYYTQRTSIILRIRYNHIQLADALRAEGKIEKSNAVLDRIVEIMPGSQFPMDVFTIGIAESYFRNGESEKAISLIKTYLEVVYDDLAYFLDIQKKYGNAMNAEAQQTATVLNEIMRLVEEFEQTELSQEIESRVNLLVKSGS
ncbi:MAG: DUF2723 domain-containing protein [Bacteroidetes bacterium]|jgi:hypothetical protein|nr:DUF2723 domain-containing protein [Bacteroidota bacterium]MBT3750201.1 DUF2723 domain-containing protein [Bacteroidota bacterium]MBT4400374.1 DUF2723 domain-containing protein [Bacteroidota bacterium]MBT4411110.1 DUF2723 domain-containing protein [Bacteroidota bacterium]